MRPKDFMTAASGEGGVVLTARPGSEIKSAGCSTSVIDGQELGDKWDRWSRTITISAPHQGEVGVVGVSVFNRANADFRKSLAEWYSYYHHFLLGIGWRNGRPWIDLNQPWIPLRGRCGRVDGSHNTVEAKVGNVIYTGSKRAFKNHGGSARHVDAGLICRYLTGQASELDLERMSELSPLGEQQGERENKWVGMSALRREIGLTYVEHVALSSLCTEFLSHMDILFRALKKTTDLSEDTLNMLEEPMRKWKRKYPQFFTGRYAKPVNKEAWVAFLTREFDTLEAIVMNASDEELPRRLRRFRESGRDDLAPVSSPETPENESDEIVH